MSGVTHSQLVDLINITLKDMPHLPIEDVISVPCESDEEIGMLIRFIKEHYTTKEIERGLEKHLEHLTLVIKSFRSEKNDLD